MARRKCPVTNGGHDWRRRRHHHLISLMCLLVTAIAMFDQVSGQASSNQESRASTMPMSSSSMATAEASSSMGSEGSPIAATSSAGPRRNSDPRASRVSSESLDEDPTTSEMSEQPDARPRRPMGRRGEGPPVQGRHRQRARGDEDEDCDYGADYEYNSNFFRTPMRHLNRMMNSVFDRIQDMGDTGNGAGQSAMASSSAFSDTDGISRMSSSVSSNGRTRGIISETRNGRTVVRRFGDSDDGDDRAESRPYRSSGPYESDDD